MLSSRYDISKLILFIHATIYSIAESMVWAIEIIFLYDLGFTYTVIFLIYSFPSLATFLFTWRWGRLIDKKGDSRPFLLIGAIAFSAVPFAYLLVRNAIILLIISFVSYSIAVARTPAINAEATLLGENRASSVGDVYAGISIGWTLGSFIDTIILSYTNDYSMIFFIAIIFSLISTPFLLFYKSRIIKREERRRRKIPKSFIYFGILQIGTGLFYNVFLIIFYSIITSRSLYSLAMFLASITSIISSPLYGRLAEKVDKRLFLSVATTLRTLYMLLLIIVKDKLLLIILYSLPLWNAIMIPLISIAGEEYEGGEAEAQGVLNSILSVSYFIGGSIAGIIADYLLRGNLHLVALFGILICFASTIMIITHFIMKREIYSKTALK